ncbi:MAG: hypothetical protein AMJ81_11260 [Phycisphaerae bacterium SM23_33]|nr:MAG: hypothetical protein AMJ81_11260 [Phycisphaerae bacterium SM23_33]
MEGERLQRLPLPENLLGQGLILTSLALMAMGVVMAVSTASADGAARAWYYRRDIRQAFFVAAALPVLLTLWRVDYRRLARRPWPESRVLGWVPSPAVALLLVGLVTAVMVLLFGHGVGHRLRWLRYGPIGFQPSEVVKFAVLIVLAVFLSRPDCRPRDFRRTFLPAIMLVGLACGLVVTQDFGTAAIIGMAAAAMMLMAGAAWHHFLAPAPAVALGVYWFMVRDAHRWARIQALMEPLTSSRPAAYQPRQALIAVASGAAPAGLGAGVAKHGYLPEDSTDFIFSTVCEELGVGGMVLVIGLFLVWLWLCRRAVLGAADRFAALLAGGLGFVVGLQAVIHIAVNVRWFPPTGVCLPFLSAGGTSLLAMTAATAIIVSVSARRRVEPETL